MAGGTIVDGTIIAAPSSTKNEARQRDPEMHQTRKGQQWYFGMKLHIGVDSKLKLIHSLLATAANVHDGQCWVSWCTEMRGVSMATRPTKGGKR